MKWTTEQQAILKSSGDLIVNAVAGSGKTTTLIEYAKTRPKSARILYLAFNKSVREEARRRFAAEGLLNVSVETAHSLAYKYIVRRNGYQVRSQGYKTYEIAEILQLERTGERHSELILANHISRYVAFFCNSSSSKVKALNYLDTLHDAKAKAFVATFLSEITRQTRMFLKKMDQGAIEVTHDFYLKKFQLSNPELPFDYFLFDEGQDASPAMLAVFLRQKGTKVIVGDTHQQIYGWRYAINSLEEVEFPRLYLSNSFRFNESIARLAREVLHWKHKLSLQDPVQIKGLGKSGYIKTRAVLGRTNLGLLLRAIDLIHEERIPKLYFEGNFYSYTYADEGASLYDVLNLYLEQPDRIRDKLIRQMHGIEDLEDYVEKTEDVQLGMMMDIVREYGKEIPGILKEIKEKHVSIEEKEQAEVIFSTVHRCKGMEYDTVELVDDFLTEAKLDKMLKDHKTEHLNLSRLNEEVNLVYVAITRTKSQLSIPASLVPKGFIPSGGIEIRMDSKVPELAFRNPKEKRPAKGEKTNRAAYQPWTKALDDELSAWFHEGKSVAQMAAHFQRSRGAIRARIAKLALTEW